MFETALAYTDAGRMADNAILFKFVAKTVGMKYGIMPTFMAKPYSDVRAFPKTDPASLTETDAWLFRVRRTHCPRIATKRTALMSSHIHVSIRDESGRNIFAVTEEERKNGGRQGAAFDDTKYLSQEAEWFLAGVLAGLSDGQFPTWCTKYEDADVAVVPMMCPTINSYKRLLGGEVSRVTANVTRTS